MRQRLLGIFLGLPVLFVPVSVLRAQGLSQTTLINRDAAVYSKDTGKIYLVDTVHNAVIVLSSSKPPSSIEVGASPIALALNPRTGRIYVVDSGSRSVSVIDASTDKVVATVPTAARPYAIAIDEAANKVYVSNTFSNMLSVIDGASNHVANLPTGSADAIVVDSDRHRVYLFGYESDTLTELDPATERTTKIPAGAMHLWGIARAGKTLYVSHVQDASIAAIDLETHALRNLPTGSMPCAIAINKTTGQVYVANYADGTVTILEKEERPTTVAVSPHPQAVALDEAAGLLYVASPQQNTVTVVDTQTRNVRQTYRNLDHPYAVVLMGETHAAYTVNLGNAPFTLLTTRDP
ncbi:YncE family protein [Edaphobacter modestus]|uniref:YVTN family beta-propeller protein n=1 Tax=Edaphobacter modestus TaxID=388466 RepID=A0A4Q7YT26_9BACT|nr:YncE family protein [Edaphobacter modestus]RZU40700.1 YVTN family beta-propeller protein [Edaphobacter modestus]